MPKIIKVFAGHTRLCWFVMQQLSLCSFKCYMYDCMNVFVFSLTADFLFFYGKDYIHLSFYMKSSVNNRNHCELV